MNASHIVLIGPMGAGKSTIGRQLAKSLDLAFLDVDQLIVDQAGADIPWIFDVEGETGFRVRETTALKGALGSQERSVIATGGGIVKLEDNRTLLAAEDAVVYLYADVETQYQRTLKDKNRPMLQNEDPEAKLQALMKERAPLYEAVSDLKAFTHRQSISEVLDEITTFWQGLA